MEVLAIVPARSGSKGLPGKNLAPLGGRPLIAWTLDAARDARCVSRVVVSTDCPRISQVALEYGAEAPFRRPARLARDDTPTVPVLRHVVRWLAQHESYAPDWVVCMQPTSPLRTGSDVDGAVATAVTRCADAVVSVAPALTHPLLAKRIAEDGRLEGFLEVSSGAKRRQDLPPTWAPNGAVYVARPCFLMTRDAFDEGRVFPHPMPAERSVDVDGPLDLEWAAFLLGRRASGGVSATRVVERGDDALELGELRIR